MPPVRPIAVSLLCLMAMSGPPARAADEQVAAEGVRFLADYCFRCHSLTRGQKEEVEGVDFANRASLMAKRPGEDDLIVPGKPEASLIWKVVAVDRSMPKKPVAKPDAGRVQALRRWIEAGAEFPGSAASRTRRSELEELDVVAAFLKTVPEAEVKRWRFFTLRTTHNRPEEQVTPGTLATLRMGLSKAINSVSTRETIFVPKPLDPEATILAVDLARVGWERRRLWDEMLRFYPYGLVPDEDATPELRRKSREVYDLAGTELPIIRADWFIANATRSPLYDLFLDLPGNARELEARLGVDVEADFRQANLQRAAVSKSRVSDFNRLVDRHEASHGYYWKSYDFRTEEGSGQLTTHPLGPPLPKHPFPRQAFQHAGGEIIFSLPNNLQGYLLVDQAGKKIDPGPVEIVHDDAKIAGTPLIVNGLSCMGCHSRGMVSFLDTIRGGIAVRGDAKALADRLFLTPMTLRDVLKADEETFLAANERAVGPFRLAGQSSAEEPIAAAVADHLRNVDLGTASADLDLDDPATLRAAILPRSSRLRRLGLGPLIEGGSIRRETWESRKALNSLFQEAAREIGDHTPKTVF